MFSGNFSCQILPIISIVSESAKIEAALRSSLPRPNALFTPIASARPANVPYAPTAESLIVPMLSLRAVSIPASTPLPKSVKVLGRTMQKKSTALAPHA